MSSPDPDTPFPMHRSNSGSTDILALTAEIVSAYVGNAAHVQPGEIPEIIRSVRAALSEKGASSNEATPEKASKMSKAQWSKLITADGIKSLIDGKLYKTMKRALSRHGHTPESYREAHGLPADFPMVAPSYSARRSQMARDLGLGARGRGAKPTKAKGPAKAPTKRKTPVN